MIEEILKAYEEYVEKSKQNQDPKDAEIEAHYNRGFKYTEALTQHIIQR